MCHPCCKIKVMVYGKEDILFGVVDHGVRIDSACSKAIVMLIYNSIK